MQSGMTTEIDPINIPRTARPAIPSQIFARVINERDIQNINPTTAVMNVVNFLPAILIKKVANNDPKIANNEDTALNIVDSTSFRSIISFISGMAGDG